MNIAILGSRGIPANYSGVERSVEEVSKRLADRGHKITVYCRPAAKAVEVKDYNNNITLITLPTINNKHLGTFVHVFLSTLHVLFKKVDIVHFQAMGPSVFSFLPRLFGKKTAVTVRGLDWRRGKWGFIARRFLKLCEYSSVYFPNRTIVVSETLKGYFEERFGKRIDFIPNGAEIAEGPALAEGPDINGLEKNKYILFAGRLVPEKGIQRLIRAFTRLETGMKLIIAGESSFTGRYVKYLKEISGPNVIFTGFVKGKMLERLYAGAYLFVLPSEVEGLSLSLLEAMGYGKCVLASDIPENMEVLGDTGFHFKSGSEKDLRVKLQMLLDNPRSVAEKGREARDRVIEKYNWDTITDEIEDLYFSLKRFTRS